MTADQASRLWEAVITLIVTCNAALLVWIAGHQRRNARRVERHLARCLDAHNDSEGST